MPQKYIEKAASIIPAAVAHLGSDYCSTAKGRSLWVHQTLCALIVTKPQLYGHCLARSRESSLLTTAWLYTAIVICYVICEH